MSDRPSRDAALRRWWRPWRRAAALEREVAKRDQALRTVRHHAREIELKAATFGLDRILDPRLSEIEQHALSARLAADYFIGAAA